jgi:hypothetical protein
MKGRRTPPPTPQQIATGRLLARPSTDESAWRAAKAHRTLDHSQIAIGVVRAADLCHTWVSLYGTDITTWGAYRDEGRALDLAGRIGALVVRIASGDAGAADLDALLDAAAAECDDAAAVLPDQVARRIMTALAGRQQRRN